MERIYICHQFGGKEENKEHAEQIVKALVKKDPSKIYISVIHLFGYLYNDVSYINGIEMCINELETCDKIFTFYDKLHNWSDSRGCKIEKQYCIIKRKPIVNIDLDELLKE